MAEDTLSRDSLRCFLAIPLHDLFSLEIERILRTIRDKIPGVRWIEPPQFHMTLHFFGSISVSEIERIDASMRECASRSAPLRLGLDRIGGFPSLGRPNIFWMGVEKNAAEILSFQKALSREIQNLGFEIETRPFHPHATIGRVKRPVRDAEAILSKIPLGLPTAEKTAGHFVLYRSHCLPEGARYEVLKTYPLSKKA